MKNISRFFFFNFCILSSQNPRKKMCDSPCIFILPNLQEYLPTDLTSEICMKWMDPDLFFWFTNTDTTVKYDERIQKWNRLIKAIIIRSSSSTSQRDPDHQVLQFLIRSMKWKKEGHPGPALLVHVLRYAIKYNHLGFIHHLLDTYPFLAEKKYAQILFKKALFCNRPHLLRLFVVLWNFPISNALLQKCLNWIDKDRGRTKHFQQCRNE